MNVLLRKLRGVVATGLIWCPVWAALFAVLVSIVAIFVPIRGDAGPIRMIAIIGGVGFVSGGLFGIGAAPARRRRKRPDDALHLTRLLSWLAQVRCNDGA
jgi:hypothetical protein